MKILILLSLVLIVGCSSTTSETVVPEVTDVPANSVQSEVIKCINDFMELQAHVLDATKACSHIYGLDSSRGARTTDLQ